MPYVLSPSEKSSLEAVYANVKNPTHPDFKKYFLAYDALYNIITDATGLTPKSGVDPSAWLWLQSARVINKGEGQFSTFIREYTKAQYSYRLGTTASDELIQAASNAIATKVIEDSLLNGYPTLVDIGNIDAGQIVGQLYGDLNDFSAWSGAPLFTFLGTRKFFDEHIAEPDNVQGARNGAYDVFAMYSSVVLGMQSVGIVPSIDTLVTLFRTPLQGSEGAGFGSVLEMFDKASQYLNDRYGASLDSPLTSLNLLLAEGFFDAYSFGRIDAADSLGGTSDGDIIVAGGGADSISGSIDRDILDGGDGKDTLDYRDLGLSLTVDVYNSKNGNAAVSVLKDRQGKDAVINVETYYLSGGSANANKESTVTVHGDVDIGGIRFNDSAGQTRWTKVRPLF